MNARETILAAIKTNQPAPVRLPAIDHHNLIADSADLTALFCQNLEAGGGSMQRLPDMTAVQQLINEKRAAGGLVLNLISQAGNIDLIPPSLEILDSLQQVFIIGSVAVAENGAVWVTESKMINRILPFISDQLYLVVYEKQLVSTMHDAYEKIKTDDDGFGVFIASPSKTADIEQSLVIGAHGARKLVVLVIAK
ncbi:MAG TPA: LUD domain-containing protein [Chitinophagaceae bacterium]|nr:LUD domain-containing protein [Chitinophagaceae bacterium]